MVECSIRVRNDEGQIKLLKKLRRYESEIDNVRVVSGVFDRVKFETHRKTWKRIKHEFKLSEVINEVSGDYKM